MIIEAKASRQSDQPQDLRKRFEFNLPEKTSRLPLFVTLIITGIAAFVKSAFAAQPQGPAEDPRPEEDGHGNGAGTVSLAVAAANELEVDPMTTGSIEALSPRNTIGGVMSPWITPFVMLDPIELHYTAASFETFGPRIAPFFPAAVTYRPQNDNAEPVSTADTGSRGSIAAPPHAGVIPPADQDHQALPDHGNEPGQGDGDDDDEDEDNNNTPINRAPMTMGPVRLNDVFAGQVMLIGLSQLLSGASDPDGDVLTINDITVTGGTLVQIGTGWSFLTVPGMLGVITFTYNISDGLLDIMQTAMLEVVRNTVYLTPGHDVFVGTPWDDDIDGLAGNDIIDARAGNDIVVGGQGDDHLNGGDGDDQLFGELGADVIFGGNGNDVIGGGEGNDRLFGEDGDDVVDGDEGNDLLMGGAGNDVLDGGDGHDELLGEDGDDVLVAGLGDDLVRGGNGSDVIQGNAGSDTLSGGAGADFITGEEGNDTLEGNVGDDTLLAGAGDDTLIGDDGDDMLDGDAGSDTLVGGTGNDTLIGGDGDDLISAGSGDDQIIGDAGDDIIDGGDGHDILDYSEFTADIHIDMLAGVAVSEVTGEDLFEHIEEVIGGQGNDTFVICAMSAMITGGSGDDLFVFAVNDQAPIDSLKLVSEILDFVVGDRIHVADYDIAHRPENIGGQEQFDKIYAALEDSFDGTLPIRVSHAYYDDMDHTIIEADVDRNDFYEISITLDGVHLPLSIGYHVA